MQSFLKWINETDKDLVTWAKSNGINFKKIAENNIRTGVKPQYPEGYVRSQYPDGYFPPVSATAYLDLQNSKKVKSVAPPDTAV